MDVQCACVRMYLNTLFSKLSSTEYNRILTQVEQPEVLVQLYQIQTFYAGYPRFV